MSSSTDPGRGRSRRGRAGPALAALALALGCTTLSVPQEQQLGARLAAEARQSLPLVRDRVVEGYVQEIGQRLVRAAGPQPFAYRFHVVASDEINAFAMPAGYVYLHTGTILRARNVSELAGVMAHEVGHVAERHIAENYARQQGASIARNLAVLGVAMVGGPSGAVGLAGDLTAVAVLNSFGREAEREADAFAVRVMPRAGYDPRGLVTFFETLVREGGPSPPSFLSSHPATAERIQATSRAIAALGPLEGLRQDDGGRLEIIQRRIRLLAGQPGAPGERARRR
jgi:predicted Zn-dependent protease